MGYLTEQQAKERNAPFHERTFQRVTIQTAVPRDRHLSKVAEDTMFKQAEPIQSLLAEQGESLLLMRGYRSASRLLQASCSQQHAVGSNSFAALLRATRKLVYNLREGELCAQLGDDVQQSHQG